jgi:hypothetical protein
MIRTWTNLAWPDDPYRTGQQLYRRPVPRLAAFTTAPAAAGTHPAPAAAAIVYLPLHRTRTVSVTEQTLMFGFRAVTITDPAQAASLAAVADLDLLQARRHAAVLAGYRLARDLTALRQDGDAAGLRGLAAVEREWADRGPAAGKAATFDCGLDLPGGLTLEEACEQASLVVHPDAGLPGGWQAVARALMIALVCARYQGRYQWDETLRMGQVMATTAWDCLPSTGAEISTVPGPQVAGAPPQAQSPAAGETLK